MDTADIIDFLTGVVCLCPLANVYINVQESSQRPLKQFINLTEMASKHIKSNFSKFENVYNQF